MNDWFNTAGVEPSAVLLRLIAALVLGGAVAWIHERTSRGNAAGPGENGNSFTATLVLLAVLIAAVTQVIGDNVARAFSLVGALSIVRFRTVVRDTRDTAFVIFSVVVGMAAGAQNLWVALFCLVVAGPAAFVLAARPESTGGGGSGSEISWRPDQTLRVRAAMAVPVEQSVSGVMAARGWKHRLTSIGTVKQGTAMEATWDIAPPANQAAEELVREIGRIDGIQDVRLGRAGSEENLSK